MLAERFLPRLFDQIAASAASAPDGVCPDLIQLEDDVSDQKEKPFMSGNVPDEAMTSPHAKSRGNPEAAKRESAQLSEWLSSQAVRSWARVEPSIGAIDLRPYLFVAKDRKDYFGPTTALGQLASIAEKLLGSKFAVQGLETELRQLAIPEAAQVFDLVRARIVGSDTFDTEPAGAAGMAVLVKAQPGLQSNLLDFLEALPPHRVGPWACSGWEGVIKDTDQNQRHDRLLETWKREGRPLLKRAADAALRTRRPGVVR
jgi:hypothetical protein